jgi:hypothetical protein
MYQELHDANDGLSDRQVHGTVGFLTFSLVRISPGEVEVEGLGSIPVVHLGKLHPPGDGDEPEPAQCP